MKKLLIITAIATSFSVFGADLKDRIQMSSLPGIEVKLEQDLYFAPGRDTQVILIEKAAITSVQGNEGNLNCVAIADGYSSKTRVISSGTILTSLKTKQFNKKRTQAGYRYTFSCEAPFLDQTDFVIEGEFKNTSGKRRKIEISCTRKIDFEDTTPCNVDYKTRTPQEQLEMSLNEFLNASESALTFHSFKSDSIRDY